MKIEAFDLVKSYSDGDRSVPVLQGASLTVEAGSCIALLGASGSGKSTMLHCLALLDRFESGRLLFDGVDVSTLDDQEASRWRLEKLGFVFQFHHLIPELTAAENVQLPASLLGGKNKGPSAREALDWVGLADKHTRFPWQLSGGEQQRVAIARALVNRPQVLFTDEATGNLDRPRAEEILDLLLKINREFKTTLLSVTHDADLAARYSHRYRLKDGKIWDCVGL
ncbi:MAG: ABC transporter ATP-binding protein [Bdellovibrionales bacterium]|nr:ABC transporter ATP-binding protein [Bdellovibrionales bacterium]